MTDRPEPPGPAGRFLETFHLMVGEFDHLSAVQANHVFMMGMVELVFENGFPLPQVEFPDQLALNEVDQGSIQGGPRNRPALFSEPEL